MVLAKAINLGLAVELRLRKVKCDLRHKSRDLAHDKLIYEISDGALTLRKYSAHRAVEGDMTWLGLKKLAFIPLSRTDASRRISYRQTEAIRLSKGFYSTRPETRRDEFVPRFWSLRQEAA